MHHLAHAVVEFDRAGDEAPFSDGKEAFEPPARGVEEDEGDVAGLVLNEDLVGRTAASRRGRPMDRDGDGERHRLAHGSLGDRALHLPRDAAVWQVEQQVDDPRGLPCVAEQPVEQRRDLRPDAGSRAAGAKSGSRREGRRAMGG